MDKDRESTIIRECVEIIEKQKNVLHEGDSPYSEGETEEGFDITKTRFFKIRPSQQAHTIGFVDGGSGTILKGADFSISLNRVAGVLYRENEVIPLKNIPGIIEYYTITLFEPLKDGKMAFKILLFPREEEFNDFLPFNNEILLPLSEVRFLKGRNLPQIETFGATAMRFVEWKYATKMIEQELGERDILVRDGSLQTGFSGEILLVRELYSIALKKQVYLTGLSKTCRLFTKRGEALMPLIDVIGTFKYPESSWYYYPSLRFTKADNLADVYFVKLHKYARSPFRFDIYLEQSKKLSQQERDDIISNISLNATDLSFPGYPYGLIKVDQLSRVSDRELEPQKIQLLAEFDPDIYNKYIKPRIRAVDAHDLLNKIRKN
jgi:hypothetical protein